MTVSSLIEGLSSTDRVPDIHDEANNAWQQPGKAAYDFRSDVITCPTESMLKAIINTTLMDDVYQEDATTNDLEALIADLTCHQAGLMVVSGTMGNQVALRTHLNQPPCSLLCDVRGHIVNYEGGGISSVANVMLIPITPMNGHHITLEDVKRHAIISDDIHACPTTVISLENTLDGLIMPLDEVRAISSFARQNNIKLHLDGARLWEAVAAGAGSLSDFAKCFDSVNLCFSKGLGAPIGSLIVGSRTFITRARRIRKMIGGGTRQSGIISAAARVAVEENFGTDGEQLRKSHARAREIAAMWLQRGGRLVKPVETNMVWIDIQREGYSIPQFANLARAEGILTSGGRLVVHYQISDDAVQRLGRAMDKLRANEGRNGSI